MRWDRTFATGASHSQIFCSSRCDHHGRIAVERVPEGTYFMVALPIKLMETEAAPARVILMGRDLRHNERERGDFVSPFLL